MKLKDYLKKNKIKKQEFSKDLQISRITLNNYINNPSKVSYLIRIAIEYLTNNQVTINDWKI